MADRIMVWLEVIVIVPLYLRSSNLFLHYFHSFIDRYCRVLTNRFLSRQPLHAAETRFPEEKRSRLAALTHPLPPGCVGA
jgi:hypothetical protein